MHQYDMTNQFRFRVVRVERKTTRVMALLVSTGLDVNLSMLLLSLT